MTPAELEEFLAKGVIPADMSADENEYIKQSYITKRSFIFHESGSHH